MTVAGVRVLEIAQSVCAHHLLTGVFCPLELISAKGISVDHQEIGHGAKMKMGAGKLVTR